MPKTIHPLIGFKMLLKVAILFFLISYATVGNAQNSTCLSEDSIQDIRLVNGDYGDFMGRVEIRFNGTWGTICDNSWSKFDSDVVCRTLGYETSICAVSRAEFGPGPAASPIWMTSVRCSSSDNCLQDCSFIGLNTPITSCSHGEDAGLICDTDSVRIPPPSDLTLLNSTTSSLTIRFSKVNRALIPEGASTIRYRIIYVEEITQIRRTSFFFDDDDDYDYYDYYDYDDAEIPEAPETQITTSFTTLKRNTSYTVQIGVDFRFNVRFCFSYIEGSLSDPVQFSTSATVRNSSIPVRLTPNDDYPEFMGRVEVMFNKTWGTVCEDRFSTIDGHVICRALGYHRAMCVPFFRRAEFRQGPTLPIWLDDLDCPASGEIIEDCEHRGWGVHNCQPTETSAVVCAPNDGYLGAPRNLTVDLRGSSVLIRWQPPEPVPMQFNLGRFQYRLDIRSTASRFSFSRTVSFPATEFELNNVILNTTYTVTVKVQVRFTPCLFSFFDGPLSEPLNFTTVPIPPEGPPTLFHVIVLSSTSVELNWNAPLESLRNGEVSGYNVFVSTSNGRVQVYDFPRNESEFDVAIIDELMPSTRYTFSVAAYNTAGQGPRSEFVTHRTFARGEEPLINHFGVNGNGLNIAVRFTFQRDVHIHCGSNKRNVSIDWFTSEGVKISIDDRNLREGHYDNGTTVLQVAASRRLNDCDGGVYTCVANDSLSGAVHQRNFTLIIGQRPPEMNRPYPIEVQSTSIQVGWDEPECDGGHNIAGYSLGYYESDDITSTSVSIPLLTETNYTARDLKPNTMYVFRVNRVTAEGHMGVLSDRRFILTLPAAPSPPRDVSFRIVSNTVIEVSWRPPVDPNGVIIRYTVYILIVSESRAKRQSSQTPQVLVERDFNGNITSGNITLPTSGVTYTVQVTATIMSGDDLNEGSNSLPIKVPLPIPDVLDVQRLWSVETTNASMTLAWDLPPPPFLPVDFYILNFTAIIMETSSSGQMLEMTEIRTINVQSSEQRVTIEPLTPGTRYQFTIAALSDGRLGAPAFFERSTDEVVPSKGKLSFLQLRLGPVHQCSSFETSGSGNRLETVEESLISTLNQLCNCDLTTSNLQNGFFSCPNGLDSQVVYRARILGNTKYSAQDLLRLAEAWASTGQAALNIEVFRFSVDSQCSVTLDSLTSPDCPFVQPPDPVPTESGVSSGEYALLIIILLILCALVAVVLLLVVMILRQRKPFKNRDLVGRVRFQTDRRPDDVQPFAELDGNTSRGSTPGFEEKPSQ